MKKHKKLITAGILVLVILLMVGFVVYKKNLEQSCPLPGYPDSCKGTCYDPDYYNKHVDMCANV